MFAATTTVIVHQANNPITQILVSVAAGLVIAAVLCLLRWSRRAYRRAVALTAAIEAFGAQWAAAASFVTEVHEMRREISGGFASLLTTIEAVNRMAARVAIVIRRVDDLVTTVEKEHTPT